VSANKARWINKNGYDLDKIRDDKYLLGLTTKAIYEFRLKKSKPMTLILADGTRVQPDRHLAETDMGSIPLSLQFFFPKDRFLLSYILHDSGYHHHGLYVKKPGRKVYRFTPMTKGEIDELLRISIEAEGGGIVRRNIIYRAVQAGGFIGWNASQNA